jgi:hypothetical protein
MTALPISTGSLVGDELSTLGSAYPNRVKKLVYLDAYDYYAVFHQLPDLPNTPYTGFR